MSEQNFDDEGGMSIEQQEAALAQQAEQLAAARAKLAAAKEAVLAAARNEWAESLADLAKDLGPDSTDADGSYMVTRSKGEVSVSVYATGRRGGAAPIGQRTEGTGGSGGARAHRYMELTQQGLKVSEIARMEGVEPSTVRDGLDRLTGQGRYRAK